jgi:Ca2+-binding EF-hand superfamily protein
MSTTDQLVREAVDQIFQKMDQNHDSYLDAHEVITLLNMGLRHLGKHGSATFSDAKEFIAYADANRDDELSKEEMFVLLKKIMSRYNH